MKLQQEVLQPPGEASESWDEWLRAQEAKSSPLFFQLQGINSKKHGLAS